MATIDNQQANETFDAVDDEIAANFFGFFATTQQFGRSKSIQMAVI
jgi:hypothetical protein